MHTHNMHRFSHAHVFGQDAKRPGENRTLIVIALTAITMVVEVTTGILSGSMALLADGLHMASHTVALGITAFAYAYARRHAADARFSFGTGKVNALGGFAGAMLLAVFSATMAWESVTRLVVPIPIAFDQAIAVACVGLVVNGLSVFVLGANDHHHEHGHSHDHHHDAHGHHHHHHGGSDHNLRAAYFHVLADALTSLLAIAALVAGKFLGWAWMDPLMGIVGAVLVARWSIGLLRTTSATLLDTQARDLAEQVRSSLEGQSDDRVGDLHVWSVGPGIYAAEIVLVSHDGLTPDQVKARLPQELGLVHTTVELHPCGASPA
ncbi:MAG: CDF family Co(II)/Ni(II) efflux transporter DmeF [Pseudomonadota bacterium]